MAHWLQILLMEVVKVYPQSSMELENRISTFFIMIYNGLRFATLCQLIEVCDFVLVFTKPLRKDPCLRRLNA